MGVFKKKNKGASGQTPKKTVFEKRKERKAERKVKKSEKKEAKKEKRADRSERRRDQRTSRKNRRLEKKTTRKAARAERKETKKDKKQARKLERMEKRSERIEKRKGNLAALGDGIGKVGNMLFNRGGGSGSGSGSGGGDYDTKSRGDGTFEDLESGEELDNNTPVEIDESEAEFNSEMGGAELQESEDIDPATGKPKVGFVDKTVNFLFETKK